MNLKINGRIIHGVSELKVEVRNYFEKRFSQSPVPDFEFDLGNHAKISEEQSRLLEVIPSREEIKNAVWACGVDKAPGFDGYTFKFIKELWDVIEEDIYASVLEYFISRDSLRSVNITLVSLIPKIPSPTSIEDYTPISMVDAIYKIISKILSFRLKEVIAPLIDNSQSAFIMDRQILDGVLVANESLRWLKKKKIPGALVKLDFQKAYDSVNWSFLEQVMIKMGFGRLWIQWIINFVSSYSMSILLNGSPLKPF